jgi:hypothetical protein
MLIDHYRLTRGGRRSLVLGYYAVAGGLIAIAVFMLPSRWSFVLILLVPALSWFIALPGKFRPDGSLRSSTGFLLRGASAPHTPPALHRTGAGDGAGAKHNRFDERDRSRRDHAHFMALSYLTLALIPLLVTVTVAYAERGMWLFPVAFAGTFVLFVLATSLPQAILLWTEPDPEPENTTSSTSLAGAAQ